MAVEPNPIDDPDLFDSILIAGVRSPGVVTISGHDREIGWDVQKGKGQKGARITRTSEDPIKFLCTFYMADAEEWDAWPAFLAVVKSSIGTTPNGLDIYHPDLAEVEIKSVVEATQLGTVHDGKGGQTKAIRFLEYRPPVKAGGTASGSKTSTASKNKAPDPNAAAKAELARLTKEYEQTPWG